MPASASPPPVRSTSPYGRAPPQAGGSGATRRSRWEQDERAAHGGGAHHVPRHPNGYTHRDSGPPSERRAEAGSSRGASTRWDDDGARRAARYDDGARRAARYDDGRPTRRRSRSPPRAPSPPRRDAARPPRGRASPRAAADFEADRARDRRRYDQASRRERDDVYGSRERGGGGGDGGVGGAVEEEAPNFEPSGLLAKESNQRNGVALKYHEPPEARKSKKPWRLYVFKDGKEIDMLPISRQSCYLFGRDREVADVPVDHPSASKQHAVLQYRQTVERNEFGDEKRQVKPFVIDLDSANGTSVNGQEIPTSRYFELRSGDTLRFAASSREYVLLREDVA